jgi:hypothetical protein
LGGSPTEAINGIDAAGGAGEGAEGGDGAGGTSSGVGVTGVVLGTGVSSGWVLPKMDPFLLLDKSCVLFLVEYVIKSARNSCFLSLKLISCS